MKVAKGRSAGRSNRSGSELSRVTRDVDARLPRPSSFPAYILSCRAVLRRISIWPSRCDTRQQFNGLGIVSHKYRESRIEIFRHENVTPQKKLAQTSGRKEKARIALTAFSYFCVSRAGSFPPPVCGEGCYLIRRSEKFCRFCLREENGELTFLIASRADSAAS